MEGGGSLSFQQTVWFVVRVTEGSQTATLEAGVGCRDRVQDCVDDVLSWRVGGWLWGVGM